MIENIDAIRALVPDAELSYANGEIVDWLDDRPQPTDEEIAAKKLELQAEYDANQYQRDRAIAYPALAEQFDKLWHDINNGTLDNTGEFFTALKNVKDTYPKENE